MGEGSNKRTRHHKPLLSELFPGRCGSGPTGSTALCPGSEPPVLAGTQDFSKSPWEPLPSLPGTWDPKKPSPSPLPPLLSSRWGSGRGHTSFSNPSGVLADPSTAEIQRELSHIWPQHQFQDNWKNPALRPTMLSLPYSVLSPLYISLLVLPLNL